MVNKIKEFVTEQAQVLAEQAGKLRTDPVRAARKAGVKSAERIKSLKDPIRAFSRSGVKLTVISQSTAEQLIELQAQLVTSALTDAATQLERAARADDMQALMRGQADVLRATRERIVSDIAQAVTILKDAGDETRKVATQTYAHVTGKGEAAAAAKKTRKTARKTKGKGKGKAKAKRPTRKAAAKK